MIRRPRASARLPFFTSNDLSASSTQRSQALRAHVDFLEHDLIEAQSQHINANRAFRHRRHGNLPLPLSSFLDPLRLEQRHRHRNSAPKPEPPAFDQLDSFRQKLACNPYAQLLAQPVRLCMLTSATLPRSLLLNLKSVRDPQPPHLRTLVPVTLYNESLKHGKAGKTAVATDALRKHIGSGYSIGLNKRLAQWLGDYSEASHGSIKGAVSKYEGKMPPNMIATVTDLLAKSVTRSLRWPLKHGSRDFVPLRAGLADLSMCTQPAIVLFFGGRVHTKKLTDMEARVDEILRAVDAAILRTQISFRVHRSPWQLIHLMSRANARLLYPPHELSTITCSLGGSDGQQTYSVPVIPMVDLLGEEGAESLLFETACENMQFIAVEMTLATRDTVARLISCAFWLKEGLIETLPRQTVERVDRM